MGTILSIPEAAKEIGMSEQFVRKKIREGAIKVIRMGRNIKISREEVDRLKKEGC